MITSYILILTLATAPHKRITLEFNSQAACEKAERAVREDLDFLVVNSCRLGDLDTKEQKE